MEEIDFNMVFFTERDGSRRIYDKYLWVPEWFEPLFENRDHLFPRIEPIDTSHIPKALVSRNLISFEFYYCNISKM